MKVIRGDTQRLDNFGRIPLTSTAAAEDVRKDEEQLTIGETVRIVDVDGPEVLAVIDYDHDQDRTRKIWVASPIWSTFRSIP